MSLDRFEAQDVEADADWSRLEVSGDLVGWTADEVDVAECRLLRMCLTGADLDRVHVTDTVVEGCDLSGATFGRAVLYRTEFRDCRMSGIVLAHALLHDVAFVDCKLDGANFRMTAGERVRFERTILRDADFYEAKLDSACFFDCDLTGVEFSKSKLAGARLHGSTVEGIKGGHYLRGVVIDSGQVLPLAFGVFAGLGIVVDDEREPPARPGPAPVRKTPTPEPPSRPRGGGTAS